MAIGWKLSMLSSALAVCWQSISLEVLASDLPSTDLPCRAIVKVYFAIFIHEIFIHVIRSLKA